MVNKAISSNPPTADLHLTNSGSNWDWAIFAIMLFSDLCLIIYTFTVRPRASRLFNYLGILILTTSAIAYYTMASNLGNTPIQVQYLRGRSPGTTRAVWYARYIDWFITTPALLLMLLLATGLNLSSILMIIFFDLVMVVMGLIGALTHSSYKWGYYAFGLAALVYIWVSLFTQGLGSAGFIGTDARLHFVRLAGYLSFLWMLYPVCWALSEGANVISPTSEMIFYGVLDFFTKPIFIFLLFFSMRNIEYSRFGLMPLKASATAEDAALMGSAATGTGVGRHTAMASTGPGVTTGNRGATTAGASGANANTNTNTNTNTGPAGATTGTGPTTAAGAENRA